MAKNEIRRVLEPMLTQERIDKLDWVVNRRITGISLLMEGLYDVGNLSALMRTCDGLGILRMGVIETVEKYRAVRNVSQGCHKWLELLRYSGVKPALSDFRSMGYRIVGSDLKAKKTIYEMNFDTPVALVFGNESRGITPELIEECDDTFIIPMEGFSQSLNVSVAAAITLNLAVQKWRKHICSLGDLEPDYKARLREHYLRRSVKRSDSILKNCGVKVPPLLDIPKYLKTPPDRVNGKRPKFVTKEGGWY